MRRSVEKQPGDPPRLPLRKRLQLTGGALLGVAAVLAPGCGGSTGDAAKGRLQSKTAGLSRPRYNDYTEAALRRTIRPAMTQASERIITFAGEHPGLSTRSVSKHAVYLTVTRSIKYQAPEGGQGVTTDIMKLAAPRPSEGKALDPQATLAVSVSRFARFKKDPSNDFISAIDLYAPGGAKLPVGDGNLHTDGWAADETLSVGPGVGPDIEPVYDSSGIQSATGKTATDPLAAARRVALDTPALIAFTESDLGSTGQAGAGAGMP